MIGLIKTLTWYWHVMFGSLLWSIVVLLLAAAAVVYWARCKKYQLRGRWFWRSHSYEISV